VKPESIRFEFPLVGEPTRDPEATWARAMDASRWSRARKVWGLPVIESDACPDEGAFLLDRAWVGKHFAIVDGRLMVVGGLACRCDAQVRRRRQWSPGRQDAGQDG
jgi:hypothetical protein